eukprot:186094-Chlamydomonas_euryale.AAC.3
MGEYYRDVLSLETVATMNAGFCDFHVRNCPPSQQLLDECTKALQLYQEYRAESARMEAKIGCQDRNVRPTGGVNHPHASACPMAIGNGGGMVATYARRDHCSTPGHPQVPYLPTARDSRDSRACSSSCL